MPDDIPDCRAFNVCRTEGMYQALHGQKGSNGKWILRQNYPEHNVFVQGYNNLKRISIKGTHTDHLPWLADTPLMFGKVHTAY